jgi:hypothetical protein
MALMPLSAAELAQTPTLFDSFMGHVDRSHQTFGRLLSIYRERAVTLDAAADEANDLRVNRFIADMAGSRWKSDLVMRLGQFDDDLLVVDGIHRGIAYLACVEDGIGPERLPALHVNR